MGVIDSRAALRWSKTVELSQSHGISTPPLSEEALSSPLREKKKVCSSLRRRGKAGRREEEEGGKERFDSQTILSFCFA